MRACGFRCRNRRFGIAVAALRHRGCFGKLHTSGPFSRSPFQMRPRGYELARKMAPHETCDVGHRQLDRLVPVARGHLVEQQLAVRRGNAREVRRDQFPFALSDHGWPDERAGELRVG